MGLNHGELPEVVPVALDILRTASTAALLREINPDIVFNATTMIPWWQIDALPPSNRAAVQEAGNGIWAAPDLLLPSRLSDAMRRAGFTGTFINGCFPDLINPVIYDESIGPACGIGNVANVVPGLRLAAASLLNADVNEVRIRFVAHHFLSYRIPLTGTTDGAPYALQVMHRGRDVSPELPGEIVFRTVAAKFARVKGVAGVGVTVSSAMQVLNSVISGSERRAHAPGVLGRVGGYPVRIADGEVHFDLPTSITLAEALDINIRGARWDGIESCSAVGGITVTEKAAGIAKKVLGYTAGVITLENCEEKSIELVDRFERLAAKDRS
jgi:hypothetical protein